MSPQESLQIVKEFSDLDSFVFIFACGWSGFDCPKGGWVVAGVYGSMVDRGKTVTRHYNTN